MSELTPLLVEQIVRRASCSYPARRLPERRRVSRSAHEWQLADELAGRCGYRGGYRPLPQVAQVCRHARGRHDLAHFLRQRLDAPAYRPLPIHELIARIPSAPSWMPAGIACSRPHWTRKACPIS